MANDFIYILFIASDPVAQYKPRYKKKLDKDMAFLSTIYGGANIFRSESIEDKSRFSHLPVNKLPNKITQIYNNNNFVFVINWTDLSAENGWDMLDIEREWNKISEWLLDRNETKAIVFDSVDQTHYQIQNPEVAILFKLTFPVKQLKF